MNKWATTAAMLAFLSFVAVRRFRSGRRMRPIRPFRIAVRIIIIAVVAVVMTRLPAASWTVVLSGLTIGLLLGLYSLTLTSFEPGVKGALFKPHPQVGNLLIALLVLRVGWRTMHRLSGDEPAGNPFGPDASSGPPWTLLLMFVLLAYAMSYMTGLVLRGRSIPRLPEPPDEISDGSVAG